jgi:ketosteroid isomerase-like protein
VQIREQLAQTCVVEFDRSGPQNAEKNHDAAAFERLVPDDWIAINPDGKSQTKAERAAEIKTAHTTSATLGDMKVRVFGDTAVVIGTDDEITMEDGKKSSDHYVWTDVFVKRNGKWLAVASQTALIK